VIERNRRLYLLFGLVASISLLSCAAQVDISDVRISTEKLARNVHRVYAHSVPVGARVEVQSLIVKRCAYLALDEGFSHFTFISKPTTEQLAAVEQHEFRFGMGEVGTDSYILLMNMDESAPNRWFTSARSVINAK
jgi:hypothetical protein